MVYSKHLSRHARLKKMIAHEISHAFCERISFARFMELALLAPHLGYYESDASLFGKKGDFVTAPETSSLWSFCLARYCVPILKTLPADQSVILEIGGGTGRMAADLLIELERLNCLPSQYMIVEVSAALRKKQNANLKKWVPHLISRIKHLPSLPQLPIEGIILANEVMDALPVHLFSISKGLIYERYVGWHQNQFIWQQGEAKKELINRVQLFSSYLENVESYCSEIRLSLDGWFKNVQATLKKGYILLIDYGRPQSEYYHPAHTQGTLRCYYKHQCYTDPLQRVGLQDITSDVDFTQVAKLAIESELSVHAFVSQAAFLMSSGLLTKEALCYDKSQSLKLKGQINQLVSPFEMGELCKVMVLGRNLPCDLLSLKDHDRRFSL